MVWADLSSSSVSEALEGQGPFEYVFDNWAKDADSAKPAVKLAKAWDVSNYVFVSSAGMYKGASQPMKESDEVKATGQRAVEELLAAEGLPWTSFRPQYIYGPKTNKRDYIDWFFDRVVREALPIPNGGDQLVSLTNSVDVANSSPRRSATRPRSERSSTAQTKQWAMTSCRTWLVRWSARA